MININSDSTLIILDWDDTLFPTTWVNKYNINIIDKNNQIVYQKFFKNLDILLEKLFRLLIKCGNVMIITNALLNWIDISSKILPITSDFIQRANIIKIISARSDYSKTSSDPMEWKRLAFAKELQKLNKNINNIISIGDAEYEYNALVKLYVSDENQFRLLKTVKFVRNPDITHLADQIKILYNSISKICKEPTFLDLELQSI
jgi:hypothetical protein